MRELADLSFTVAVHQQVGLRIEQNRAANLLRPVVEVRDPAQRGFYAADDDRNVLETLPCALRIDDDRPVRPAAALAARRVGVIAPYAAIGGVAVDHGVHVSGGDAEEQVGSPECGKGLSAVPVRLRDDADPETLGFQYPADDGHAEAGVIDVGVTAHQDDVAAVPAQRLHLRARHGQERGRAEALGPVFPVGRDVACGLHGARIRPKFAPEF